MLKYSLTFPIILSCLYIFFSQGQYTLPTCALSCAQTAGNEVGCNSNDTICVCTDNSFIEVVSLCVEEDCSESDAQTAVDYWDIVCGYNSANTTTVTSSSHTAPATSTSITNSSSYPYGTSSATSPPGSTSHDPTPYPHGGSSASGSGSEISSSTHAAALIAAWISAVVAVIV